MSISHTQRPLTDLEQACAVNAAARVLADAHQTFHLLGEIDPVSPGGGLFRRFRRVYAALFWDTHSDVQRLIESGEAIPTPEESTIFVPLADVLYNRGKLKKNADVDRHELARALAETYLAIRKAPLFDYGNELAANVFAVLVGNSVGHRLDFRRLNESQIEAFNNRDISVEDLTTVFEIALDPVQDVVLQPGPPQLTEEQARYWEELHDYYTCPQSGWVCPTYVRPEDKKTYIVMSDGGLYPLESLTEKALDGVAIEREEIEHYLPSVERFDKEELHQVVLPYRLWVDRLTGLKIGHDGVKDELDYFKVMFEAFRGENKQLGFTGDERDFLEVPRLSEKLRAFVKKRGSEFNVGEVILETAVSCIAVLAKVIREKVDEQFAGFQPVDEPKYYVTMGGSGAGKNGLLDRARRECGGNAVVASLDAARGYFGAYFGGVGGGLDYPQLDFAARIVRKSIIFQAKERGYHLIRDCSGVPVEREMAFLDSARQSRPPRQTCVLATTAGIEQSMRRSAERYVQTGRWVEPRIIRKKHIEVSRGAPALIGYHNTDKFILTDNSGAKGAEHTILETFQIDDALLQGLLAAKEAGNPGEFIRENMTLHPTQKTDGLDGPLYADKRMDVLNFGPVGRGGTRVAVIYDREAYLVFVKKGHCNEAGRDPEQLHSNPFPFLPGRRRAVLLDPDKEAV